MRISFFKIVLLDRKKKYNFNKHASNFNFVLPLITKKLLLIAEKSNVKVSLEKYYLIFKFTLWSLLDTFLRNKPHILS